MVARVAWTYTAADMSVSDSSSFSPLLDRHSVSPRQPPPSPERAQLVVVQPHRQRRAVAHPLGRRLILVHGRLVVLTELSVVARLIHERSVGQHNHAWLRCRELVYIVGARDVAGRAPQRLRLAVETDAPHEPLNL
eukprot:scaffold35192_cov64-Phaeocystis_antarctica.AAC.13